MPIIIIDITALAQLSTVRAAQLLDGTLAHTTLAIWLVIGTRGGSMRMACFFELMCIALYMLAGIGRLLATRRPNMVK